MRGNGNGRQSRKRGNRLDLHHFPLKNENRLRRTPKARDARSTDSNGRHYVIHASDSVYRAAVPLFYIDKPPSTSMVRPLK
jgi:hypothetical protein